MLFCGNSKMEMSVKQKVSFDSLSGYDGLRADAPIALASRQSTSSPPQVKSSKEQAKVHG
jgi:hypothetical protein